MTEEALLLETFETQGACTSCTNWSVYVHSTIVLWLLMHVLHGPTRAHCYFVCLNFSDDYQSTGVKCTDGYTTDPWETPDCNVYNQTSTSSSFTCSSSDTVCENIMYQTCCGALKRWASQSYSNKGLSWAIMVRQEIYWDPECVGNMDKVVEVQPSIKYGRELLYTLMVLNNVINVVIGILVPYITIRNLQGKPWPCIPGEGETERKIISVFKKYLGFILKCGKVIPEIIAYAGLGYAANLMSEVGDDSCGDDSMTDRAFRELGEELPTTRDSLALELRTGGLILRGPPTATGDRLRFAVMRENRTRTASRSAFAEGE